MSNNIEFTDRYQALGMPWPEPTTACRGQCEGTGYVPIHRDNDEQPWRGLWWRAHRICSLWGRAYRAWRHPLNPRWWVERCDGWHFVMCPDCRGSGLRNGGEET